MEVAEAQKIVMDGLEKKKGKSKFYLKDFYAMLPDWKAREVNKLVNNMVQQGMLEYWSSGSTTLYGIKGAGKQGAAEEGEE
ncbi:MAG: dissimilatory sulfite reductase D family protein [Deltaproteobacteria bacterium]|nr:dissimilatory sulfite reductase D family protein [Deltaproteobacteria bacterium]